MSDRKLQNVHTRKSIQRPRRRDPVKILQRCLVLQKLHGVPK